MTKNKVPEGETKEARFIRVVNPRITIAIKRLRLVKQVISGNQYAMAEDQIDKIVEKLHAEVNAIKTAFDSRNKSKEDIEDVL